MNGPSVSVVMPTYNGARFILEALESVFGQTHPVEEVIVVDDGSTDNTRELLEPLADRVTYVVQANAGPGAARNRGVRLAHGDWIAFLDSDDCWEADHVSRLLDRARENPDAAMVYCGKRWVDVQGNLMEDIPVQETFPSGWIFNDLFQANYVSSTSVVIVKRQAFLEAGGFDERFRSIAEDYDLWLRISAVVPVMGVPAYTVRYRRHDSNLTHQTAKQIMAVREVLKKAGALLGQGSVNRRNQPDRIDLRRRMKVFYSEAVVGLFFLGAYEDVFLIGRDALRERHVTGALLSRWLLSLMPAPLVSSVRGMCRRLRSLRGEDGGLTG